MQFALPTPPCVRHGNAQLSYCGCRREWACYSAAAIDGHFMVNRKQKLSVVMPVFNAGPFLSAAIESILNQTYGAFEFIIYDDCSTDGSYETALRYAGSDSRIRVLRGRAQLGPAGSSKAAAMAAATPFVARMDADDVARPDRLELQLRAMLTVPDAAVIGSLYIFIDEVGRLLRASSRAQLLGGRPSPVHPSLMYRRQTMEDAGGYLDDTDLVEDTDLLRRLSSRGMMLMLPQPLMEIRMVGQNARSKADMTSIEARMQRSHGGGRPSEGRRAIAPEIYHTIALLSIYRGTWPGMMFRAMARMRFRPFGAAVKALLLLALGSISPAFARRCSHFWAVAGDRIAAPRIPSDHLFVWHDGHRKDLGPGFRDTPLDKYPG